MSSIAGVVNGVANPSYTYDARGNRLTGTGSSTSWTSFDLPAASTKGAARLEWVYGPEHQRAQERSLLNGALQRTTTYFTPPGLDGVGYEEEVAGGGKTQKAYVNLDGESVAVVIHKNGVRDTQYFVKDHLGSTTFVLNASLGAAEQLAYEPFGKRRNSNGATDAAGTLVASTNDRGYTGHEMLDELSLIHMNGRVYDPAIGRFLSADPHITDPTNAQSYNRYSYVWNNPLRFTDPTGLDADDSGTPTITIALPTVTVYATRRSYDPDQPAVRYVSVMPGSNGSYLTRVQANEAVSRSFARFEATLSKGTALMTLPGLLKTWWGLVFNEQSGTRGLGPKAEQQIGGPDTAGTPPGGPDDDGDPEPKRVTNPKHHPNSKSPEPRNVDQLYENSVVDKNGVRWAKDADGTIHRFSRPSNGETHWNGSTGGADSIQSQNIPAEIRRMLGIKG